MVQSFESSYIEWFRKDFNVCFRYTRLSDVVDHFFPPLDAKMQARNLPYINEFTAFHYWRNTLPEVDGELDEFLKKAAEAAAAAAAEKKQDKKTRKPLKKKL